MRRSPLIVMSAVLALTALTACSDDDKAESSAAPASAAPGASAAAPSEQPVERSTSAQPEEGPVGAAGMFAISASGYGPYQVDETQADLVDGEAVTGLKDAAGCTSGVGSDRFGKPEVYFAQGKLVLVVATSASAMTDAGVGVGSTLTDVKAKFPTGKELAGAAGAQGWQVVEETNALLFEASGDKVTGVASGVATSVEKNFTTGSGC